MLESFESDGVRYYTLRDLRYHKLIYNVTKDTDRRMWRAAIQQRERRTSTLPTSAGRAIFGLWRSYRQRFWRSPVRSGVHGRWRPARLYGAGESGMSGPWRARCCRRELASA